MSIRFDWDRKKAAANVKNHGVSFEEARMVFDDSLARIFDDDAHSVDEWREIIVGRSIPLRANCCWFVLQNELRMLYVSSAPEG